VIIVKSKIIFIILILLMISYDALAKTTTIKDYPQFHVYNNITSLDSNKFLQNINAIQNSNIELSEKFSNEYIYEKNKYKYLGVSFAGTLGTMVLVAGGLYSLPSSTTTWEKTTFKEDMKNLGAKRKENMKDAPQKDGDSWVFNYLAHPYVGSIYYMQAREAGFKYYESFLYSAFVSSVVWEYGIESFFQTPSKQDLLITPIVGSLLGEFFYQASYTIKKNDAKVWDSKLLGYTLLFLMDPAFIFIQRTSLKDYTSVDYSKNKNEEKITQNYSTWSVSKNSVILNIRIPINFTY
jgi:hypothetical protein